jgi:hypothetical protein
MMPKQNRSRTKTEIIARMNEVGVTKRFCSSNCPAKRVERVGKIDLEKRSVPFIMISANNAGERYDWWEDEIYIEELDVTGASFERLNTFFTDHRPSSDNAIGRIENTRVENSEIKTDVIFGTDERSNSIFTKYVDGILTDVSIGYRVNDVKVTEKKGEHTHVLVTDYEIVELSSVWRGFDAGATVGRSRDAPPPADITQMDERSLEFLEKEIELGEN